jgi:hypothetical protein
MREYKLLWINEDVNIIFFKILYFNTISDYDSTYKRLQKSQLANVTVSKLAYIKNIGILNKDSS